MKPTPREELLSQYDSKHVIYTGRLGEEGVMVRMADHDDYHHVMEVSKHMYSGRDHVYSKYHWLLDTGHTHMVLMFAGTKPISFVMMHILDERTFIGLAARTILQYRGTGAFTIMMDSALQWLLPKRPSLSRDISVGLVVPGRIHMLHKMEHQLLLTWNLLEFDSNQSQLQNAVSSKLDHIVNQVTTKQVNQIFQHHDNLRVFSSDSFCVERPWLIYDVSLDNLLKVSERNLIFESKDSRGLVNAVTFAHILEIPAGQLFEIYFYGAADLSLYKSHIIRTLRTLWDGYHRKNAATKLALHFPEQLRVSDVSTFIKDYNFGKTQSTNEINSTVNAVDFNKRIYSKL